MKNADRLNLVVPYSGLYKPLTFGNISAGCEKRLEELGLVDGPVKREIVAFLIRVRTGLDQKIENGRAIVLDGYGKRSCAIAVLLVDRRSSLQEQTHSINLVVPYGIPYNCFTFS